MKIIAKYLNRLFHKTERGLMKEDKFHQEVKEPDFKGRKITEEKFRSIKNLLRISSNKESEKLIANLFSISSDTLRRIRISDDFDSYIELQRRYSKRDTPDLPTEIGETATKDIINRIITITKELQDICQEFNRRF